jgi:hypothetical protein
MKKFHKKFSKYEKKVKSMHGGNSFQIRISPNNYNIDINDLHNKNISSDEDLRRLNKFIQENEGKIVLKKGIVVFNTNDWIKAFNAGRLNGVYEITLKEGNFEPIISTLPPKHALTPASAPATSASAPALHIDPKSILLRNSIANEIENEIEKLESRGYLYYQRKMVDEFIIGNDFLCDIERAHIELNGKKIDVVFDSGNRASTLISEKFARENNLKIYDIYVSDDNINFFNQLVNSLEQRNLGRFGDLTIKEETQSQIKPKEKKTGLRTLGEMHKEHVEEHMDKRYEKITMNSMVAKINKFFELANITDDAIKIKEALYYSSGIKSIVGVGGGREIIYGQCIVPLDFHTDVSGLIIKIALLCEVKKTPIGGVDILVSLNDSMLLGSNFSIKMHLGEPFIKSYGELKNIEEQIHNLTHKLLATNLLSTISSLNDSAIRNKIGEIEKRIEELEDERIKLNEKIKLVRSKK